MSAAIVGFVGAVAIGALLIWLVVWFVMDAAYQGRIDTMRERISLRDDRIRWLEDKLRSRP